MTKEEQDFTGYVFLNHIIAYHLVLGTGLCNLLLHCSMLMIK